MYGYDCGERAWSNEWTGEFAHTFGERASSATTTREVPDRRSADRKRRNARVCRRLSERAQRIAATFNAAGLTTTVSDNIMGTMWDKLLINVSTGAVSGTTTAR